MARPPAGSRGLSDDLIARAHTWAEHSCMDQHLPVRVADTRSLRDVASLLGATDAVGGGGSDAPDGVESVRVETVVPAPARPNNDVIENRRNDRPLPSQGKIDPPLPQAGGVADVPIENRALSQPLAIRKLPAHP